MRLKNEFANVETNLIFVTTKNLNTVTMGRSYCSKASLRKESRWAQHPVLSVMSAGVGAMLHNCCLASVNGRGGLRNCLVVVEQTWKDGTNENGGMFVHVNTLLCGPPGSRKHTHISQPLVSHRFFVFFFLQISFSCCGFERRFMLQQHRHAVDNSRTKQ